MAKTPKEIAAGGDDDTTVNIDDSTAPVVVDVPELNAEVPANPTVNAETTSETARDAQSKPTTRARAREVPDQPEPQSNNDAATAAAKELTASLKLAEDGRKAAEATAIAERQRAEQAYREMERLRADQQTAQDTIRTRELSLISNGIEAANNQLTALQADQQRHYESGDFAKATQLNVQIGKTAAQLDRLEESKKTLESAPVTRPDTGRVEAAPAPTQQSLFERYVSQFAPQSQAWLRQHPECVPADVGGNASSNAKMMAGHYEAIAAGYQPNTSDYFKVIDTRLGGSAEPAAASSAVSAAGAVTEAAPARTQAQARPAPRAQPSAPPSRDPPTSAGIPRGTRQITLSKEQQEHARLSFPNDPARDAYTKYALNLIELEAEGKLGRTTH